MAELRQDDVAKMRGGRMRLPRSRGVGGGLALLLLGVWGALIPLVGPYVHFGYTPDVTWHVTTARLWLEILPGGATALGGLMLLVGANRISTSFGAWLAAAGGAWFIVGLTLNPLLHLGSPGSPIHTSRLGATLDTLLLFTGLGALILLIAAATLGRLSVVSVRDVRAARRRDRERPPPEAETQRDDHAEVEPVPEGTTLAGSHGESFNEWRAGTARGGQPHRPHPVIDEARNTDRRQ